MQMEAEAEAKTADTRSKHLQKQIAEMKKTLSAKQKEGSKLEKELQKETEAVQACRDRLAALNFDPSAANALEQTVVEGKARVQTLQDKVDELSSHLSAVKFDFKDPSRGFDRSKVKGVVAKLVRVSDPTISTALEVAAGSKLYQVVVDSEQTAKALLHGGQLRNRVTIIPLNKVVQKTLNPNAVAAANKLVGSKAQPALELVGYDDELSAAMKYVFGSCFVCQDTLSAKKLAFTREVGARCVTWDGDDFNPSGTLTGGSRNKSNSGLFLPFSHSCLSNVAWSLTDIWILSSFASQLISWFAVLTQLHALAEAEAELQQHKAALTKAQHELKGLTSMISEHNKQVYKCFCISLLQSCSRNVLTLTLFLPFPCRLSKQLDLKQHSLDLLQKRFEGSETHQLFQSVSACEIELEAAKEAVAAAKQRKTELVAEAKDLEREISTFSQEKGQRVKAAKEKIKAAKERVERCKKEVKTSQAALQVALAESESADTERKAIAVQLDAARDSVTKLQQQVDQLAGVVAATKAAYDQASSRLEDCRNRLKECDAEISAAVKARSGMEKRKTDVIVQKKKMGNSLETLRKGAHDAVDRCRTLARDYPWISSEREHFGKPGSDYDWVANDAEKVFEAYTAARSTIESLSKKVNKKVMQMFEKAEQEYTELKRKKDVVENDKLKIQEVMDELDEKKKEALRTTWEKVNGDLGSIFSTLLPGTMAKLEPVEGTTFMDGKL